MKFAFLLSLTADCRNDLYGFETVNPDPESTAPSETESQGVTIARAPEKHEIELRNIDANFHN